MKKRIRNHNSVSNYKNKLNLILFITLIFLFLVIIFLYFVNNNKSQTNKLSQGELKSFGVYNQGIQTLDANVINGCGAVLDQPNTVYTLGNDIITDDNNSDYCIRITAENVTLDCNNYKIDRKVRYPSGTMSFTGGIYSDKDYTTIKNCDLKILNIRVYIFEYPMGSCGVFLNNAKNSHIYNNPNFYSVCAINSKNTIIENNIIKNNNFYSPIFYIINGSDNIIRNNKFQNIETGSCNVDSTIPCDFINLKCSPSSIISNNLVENSNYSYYREGIGVVGCDNGTYDNIIINNNTINNIGAGLRIYKVFNSTIINNQITNCHMGVDFSPTMAYIEKNQFNNFSNNIVINNWKDFNCYYTYDDRDYYNFGKGNIMKNVTSCKDINNLSYWPILGIDYTTDLGCSPNCTRTDGSIKVCGDDGCYGQCGPMCPLLPGYQNECIDGRCEISSCTPKTCSSVGFNGLCGAQGDGCGGCISCTCQSGQKCSYGICVNDNNCLANSSSCDTGADKCSQSASDCLMFDFTPKNGLWDDNELLSAINRWANGN